MTISTNETRLKNVSKRGRKKNSVVCLFSDEGILYKDNKLDEVVSKETLDGLLADDRITLIVFSYVDTNPSMMNEMRV